MQQNEHWHIIKVKKSEEYIEDKKYKQIKWSKSIIEKSTTII